MVPGMDAALAAALGQPLTGRAAAATDLRPRGRHPRLAPADVKTASSDLSPYGAYHAATVTALLQRVLPLSTLVAIVSGNSPASAVVHCCTGRCHLRCGADDDRHEGPRETQAGHGTLDAVGTLHLRRQEALPLRRLPRARPLPLRRRAARRARRAAAADEPGRTAPAAPRRSTRPRSSACSTGCRSSTIRACWSARRPATTRACTGSTTTWPWCRPSMSSRPSVDDPYTVRPDRGGQLAQRRVRHGRPADHGAFDRRLSHPRRAGARPCSRSSAAASTRWPRRAWPSSADTASTTRRSRPASPSPAWSIPSEIVTNAGARPGDRLILTKPLGTGIMAFAAQIGRAPAGGPEAAARSMAPLNRSAAEADDRLRRPRLHRRDRLRPGRPPGGDGRRQQGRRGNRLGRPAAAARRAGMPGRGNRRRAVERNRESSGRCLADRRTCSRPCSTSASIRRPPAGC